MTDRDVPAATAHAAAMFTALGLDTATGSTRDTPGRFVRALLELTGGLDTDPGVHLGRVFAPETRDPGMIAVPGIGFTSVCEHHLLPFMGHATVGYIPTPGAGIVGLSKLPRLVRELAARPQVQERLGAQILDTMTGRLDVLGAGVVIRSAHTCMTLRGVRAEGAEMVTSHLRGVFRDDPTVRAEFLALSATRVGG